MNEPERELESAIVDLSTTPLEELAALDDSVIEVALTSEGTGSPKLWSDNKIEK